MKKNVKKKKKFLEEGRASIKSLSWKRLAMFGDQTWKICSWSGVSEGRSEVQEEAEEWPR